MPLPPAPPADGKLLEASLLAMQRRLGVRFTAGNEVRILRDGEETFPAMLSAIQEAKERILFETYIFRHDRTGVRFFETLLEKARAGVPVYILHDAVGSAEAWELFDLLQAAGAQCAEANPIRFLKRFRRWHNRDHRKILVVDGDVGFLGGINVGDEYVEPGPNRPFRDTHLEIRGPAARHLESAFFEVWNTEAGGKLKGTGHSSPASGEARVLILAETFRRYTRHLRHLHLTAFKSATRRIWITNAYFVPDHQIRKAILNAAKRGVDVRIILPGPIDVPVVRWAAHSLYGVMLKAGVRIYEYQPRMLHAKSVVIDDECALVGSTNLDHRSFYHNLEVQSLVLDEKLTADLAAHFERDLSESLLITKETIQGWPKLLRLFYQFFYLFRRWL